MLRGTLDDFTLPDMFRLMSLAKKTGRMDVIRGAGQGKVFFRDGDVYYAESSLSKEPLGQKLIRSRALTEGQLNKALDLNAQTGKRVGEILIDSGMVTGEQIEMAVQQQIEDAVFDLLRWELGEFTWEVDVMLEVEVPISVSVENLIMEASRRMDELEVIQRKIPSADAILMMAHAPPEGAAEINITPEEWRALVLVDGQRSVAEIGTMIGKDEFETMKILYGLVSAGLVEVDHDATEAAAAASEAEAVEEIPEDVPAEIDASAAEPEVATALEVATEAAPPSLAVEEPVLEPEAIAEPPVAEPTPEPSVEAEPAFEMLEDVFEASPSETIETVDAAAPESSLQLMDDQPLEIMTPEPDVEPISAADELGIDPTPGDEVVASGAFSMSPDDLLGPTEIPDTQESPAEVIDVEAAVAAAPDEPPAEWFTDADAATGTVEVTAGDAEDPFLSDLLDQDGPEAPDIEAPQPPPQPVAEEIPAGSDDSVESPTVDRAAVVRELAGLFDEDRPRGRTSSTSAPSAPAASEGDQRKRVEDDDQINKSVISRLIKGVKGL